MGLLNTRNLASVKLNFKFYLILAYLDVKTILLFDRTLLFW